MSEYVIGDSYMDKADKYFRLVNALRNDDEEFLEPEAIINIHIATECYLCAILEKKMNRSVKDVFESDDRKDIPHGGHILYEKIHPRGKTNPDGLQPFSFEIKKELRSMFEDYREVRFPKEKSFSRVVEIERDYQLLLEIRDMAKEYFLAIEREEDSREK